MWDLMTLYDVKKKRLEDQAAFVEQKRQQKDLKDFYDTQLDFKQEQRNYDAEVKQAELNKIKNHHQTLSKYESTYQANKKNFLKDLNHQNRSSTLENKAQ